MLTPRRKQREAVEAQIPRIRAQAVSKSFGESPVLKRVDFILYPGEIHALVGENGAGKSTLTRILSGVYPPDAGQVLLDERPVRLASPLAARQCGIALLHQEPLVFPDLSVAENIFLGRHPVKGIFRAIRWKEVYAQAGAALESLGVPLDPRAPMKGLSAANCQMAELARALSQDAYALILDEPTASLTPGEVKELFRILRRLRDRKTAILFISHRLEEVFDIADRITVMRDGEIAGTALPRETSHEEIIRMMVGRSLGAIYSHERGEIGETRLKVAGLGIAGKFEGISFEIRAGEIVGMAGLVGAGRTEVANAVFGIIAPDAGAVFIDGRPVRIDSPQAALRHGLAYVPEDRQKQGLLLPASIARNITLPQLRAFTKMGWMSLKKEEAAAMEISGRLRLRGHRGVRQAVGELSGGNQQKVSLSKWLLTRPRVLILDEPTRGIDVGAKAEAHRLMGELAQQGMAIWMISSDLPEVLALSDRILVLREGRLTGEFTRSEATQERIMAAATARVTEARPR
ncbi:MAG: sugar ABC transporter ATP-binding protein [Armatimonadetes bacterium]|nr:sugar ABC transporter ATP-binding protein [Armatimonadota bacterium]